MTRNPHQNAPFSASLEISFLSGDEDEALTTGDLYRPGRIASRILDAGGRQIDKHLSRAAELVGYGPRVTAVKMTRRQRIIRHSFEHQQGFDPRNCLRCSVCREQLVCSPTSVRVEKGKLRRDAKKLLKYITSNVPSTRKQAAEHILDLSVRYDDIRSIFKQLDAIKIVHDSTRIYSEFRLSDSDDLLLSTSRKVLVSLRDSQVNTMLQDWTRTLSSSWSLEKRLSSEDHIPSWRHVAKFLVDPEAAFLVYRVLKFTHISWGCMHYLTEEILGDIASCIANTTRYFDWADFEDVFNSTISAIYNPVSRFDGSLRSIAYDYVFRFAATTPEILRTGPFQKLMANVDELGSDFETVCLLRAALMRALEDINGEFGEIPTHLQCLRDAFACPLDRAICDFTWNAQGASFIDYDPCAEIGCYIDSTDPNLSVKAWQYANHYLTSNLWSCDCMLDALSRTSFPATVDFIAFKKEKRSKHVPSKDDDKAWCTICRFIDEKSGNLYLVEKDFLPRDMANAEHFRYAEGWISSSSVARGKAFAIQGLSPLLAGCNKSGERSFIARLLFGPFACPICDEWVGQCFSAATEGMKPEDLRIQITCPHKTLVFIPEWMEGLVLAYPLAEYPDILSTGKTGVDATGPFSWRRKRLKKEAVSTRLISIRVMSTTEAEELGLVADEGEHTPSVCSDVDGVYFDSELEHVESDAHEEGDEAIVDWSGSISNSDRGHELLVLDTNSSLESVDVETELDEEDSPNKEARIVCSPEANGSFVTVANLGNTRLDEAEESDRDGCELENIKVDARVRGTGGPVERIAYSNDQLSNDKEMHWHTPERELGLRNDAKGPTAASNWRLTLTVSLSILFGILLTRLYDNLRVL